MELPTGPADLEQVERAVKLAGIRAKQRLEENIFVLDRAKVDEMDLE